VADQENGRLKLGARFAVAVAVVINTLGVVNTVEQQTPCLNSRRSGSE
jgi:hypothetical protein